MENKKIKGFENHSTAENPKFSIKEDRDGMKCSIKTLGLYKYLHTSNMVMFIDKNKLKKFLTIDEIIDRYCTVRFHYYQLRKQSILKQLNDQFKWLKNKFKFIKAVIEQKIKVFKRPKRDIEQDLEKEGYDKKLKEKEEEDEEGEEKKETKGSYDYLIKIPILHFTKEKLDVLKTEIVKIAERIKTTKNTTEKQLWINDLEEFVVQYKKI